MDLETFLHLLTEATKKHNIKWEVQFPRLIRGIKTTNLWNVPHKLCFCPITLVYYDKHQGTSYLEGSRWDYAARNLGLSDHLACNIVKAADDPPMFMGEEVRVVRQKIAEAISFSGTE